MTASMQFKLFKVPLIIFFANQLYIIIIYLYGYGNLFIEMAEEPKKIIINNSE